MDQRERLNDTVETLRTILDDRFAQAWTSIPATIQSFDPNEVTCSAQPTVQGFETLSDGSTQWKDMPLLTHVPVIFPRGGSFVITFPIKKGDEALIVFASRCIDQWWTQGGSQIQSSLRLHGLTDGFAIVGPYSKPNAIKNINTDTVQIRSTDGKTFIELTSDGIINIKAPGGVNIDAAGNGVNIKGPTVTDSEGTFNNHTVGQHTHTDPQGGVSSPPLG